MADLDTPIHTAAVRAWCATQVERLFAPLRARVGLDNPLAIGHWCERCWTRLDNSARRCPMCGGGQ